MAQTDKQQPSNLELQFLGILWSRGPSTAREVREELPDGKKRAYTTVLSVLQVMEKKGLAAHTVEGQANVYRPLVSRRQVLGPYLRGIMRNVFGGRPSAILQQLLSDAKVDPAELDEIERLLGEYRKKDKSSS